MVSTNNNIECPQCKHTFGVEQALSQQIEGKYKAELNNEMVKMKAELNEKYKTHLEPLKEREKAIKQQEEDLSKTIEEKVRAERNKLYSELKNNISQEYEDKVMRLEKDNADKLGKIKELNEVKFENEKLKSEADLQKQELVLEFERKYREKQQEDNQEKLEKIKELNEVKLANENLKRESDLQKKNIEIEFEQKYTKQLQDELYKIKEGESQKVELKLREKDEIIKGMTKQMDDMKRKAEQASSRLEGEVQELVLEDLLSATFAMDKIEEVAKGIKGADVIQTVYNNIGQNCGKILFECKRTKNFNNEWLTKLKNDAITVKADICVIVTETLPDDIERIRFKDGVWICSFYDVKYLTMLLRDSLLKVYQANMTQSNKGEKMQMLYDYLTSNEFGLQIGEIVNGFIRLQDSYLDERRSMERIWKKREKELEKILLNTNHFIGSIQGIAGNSIPEIKMIESSNKLLEE